MAFSAEDLVRLTGLDFRVDVALGADHRTKSVGVAVEGPPTDLSLAIWFDPDGDVERMEAAAFVVEAVAAKTKKMEGPWKPFPPRKNGLDAVVVQRFTPDGEEEDVRASRDRSMEALAALIDEEASEGTLVYGACTRCDAHDGGVAEALSRALDRGAKLQYVIVDTEAEGIDLASRDRFIRFLEDERAARPGAVGVGYVSASEPSIPRTFGLWRGDERAIASWITRNGTGSERGTLIYQHVDTPEAHRKKDDFLALWNDGSRVYPSLEALRSM